MTQEANAEKKPSVFTEWAGVTTAHGFLDFSLSKTVIGKLIWFILIFFSLALMCFQLQRSISDFAAHEWKTSTQGLRSGDDGVPFPSVIACNVNRFKYSKVKEYNMTLDMVDFLFMNLIQFNYYFVPSINTSAEQEFRDWRESHNFTTLADIFEALAPTQTDMITTGEGSSGGKRFIFDTQGWDYLPVIKNNFLLEGIVFQVTYGDAEVGKWIMTFPGTHVAVGFQAVKETVREEELSIANPFGFLKAQPPCLHEPKLKYIEQSYTVTTCEMECMWLIPINICNCVPVYGSPNYKNCDIEEYFTCFGYNDSSISIETGEITNFYSEEVQNAVSECKRSCGRPCYSSRLETTISQARFPSDAQNEALREWVDENISPTVRTEDTIVLELYFNTLEIKTIEMYQATTFNDLISNCGGLIGLWAGMSFLTVFQAIAYFIKFVKKRFTTKRQSKITHF